MERIQQILEDLSIINSPSGREKQMGEYLLSAYGKFADRAEIDNRGNVLFHKDAIHHENCEELMILAHMDTIGVIVTHVEENGFLRIDKIGGITNSILLGKKIQFVKGNKCVFGIVGSIPPHVKINDNNSFNMSDLWVDIGARNKEEALKIISIGDYGIMTSEFTNLSNNLVGMGALDNKSSLCIMLSVLEALSNIRLERLNLIFVATTQEEIGLHGSSAISHTYFPDRIIVLDVTHASDFPGMKKAIYGDIKLGNGPVIPVSPDTTEEIQNELRIVAAKNGVDYQIQAFSHPIGTDTNALHKNTIISKVGLVCIPCRYMHSSYEVTSTKDIQDASKILLKLIEVLDSVELDEPYSHHPIGAIHEE